MPLARLAAPFDHSDWIFEPKLDRNGMVFKGNPAKEIGL
jgi:hypothetical protein